MNKFNSIFRKVWNHTPLQFPEFSGERIMMMPVILGSLDGVPRQYHELVSKIYSVMELRHFNQVGYLTIDEQLLNPSETLRRPGLHVDGFYHGNSGAWGGGSGDGGSWGSVGNGMFVISNTNHCKAYLGVFEGEPKDEGECDHLTIPTEGEVFQAGEIYWLDGACVHESLPVSEPTQRQFVRLSLPSSGPWFEGYTKNPTGVLPSNDVLPEREEFMNLKRARITKALYENFNDYYQMSLWDKDMYGSGYYTKGDKLFKTTFNDKGIIQENYICSKEEFLEHGGYILIFETKNKHEEFISLNMSVSAARVINTPGSSPHNSESSAYKYKSFICFPDYTNSIYYIYSTLKGVK